MKNILILSSSPRRGGNSDTLCDEFLHGATDCLEDATIGGVIYGLGVWHAGEVNNTSTMERAYEMGNQIV